MLGAKALLPAGHRDTYRSCRYIEVMRNRQRHPLANHKKEEKGLPGLPSASIYHRYVQGLVQLYSVINSVHHINEQYGTN